MMGGLRRFFGGDLIMAVGAGLAGLAGEALAVAVGLAARLAPHPAQGGVALGAAVAVRVDRAVDPAPLLVADLVRRLILQRMGGFSFRHDELLNNRLLPVLEGEPGGGGVVLATLKGRPNKKGGSKAALQTRIITSRSEPFEQGARNVAFGE